MSDETNILTPADYRPANHVVVEKARNSADVFQQLLVQQDTR